MNYGIKTDDQIVAKFEHESDRDVCIEALRKVYTDTKFEAMDDVEQTEEQTEEHNNG